MPGTEAPIILEIRASTDEEEGYPVEVGVVLSSGQRYCSIIKPAELWSQRDKLAGTGHEIARESLVSEGQPVAVVASQLNELLAGRTVYCENSLVANDLLAVLFQQAGLDRGFDVDALESIMHDSQLIVWDKIMQKLQKDHKAMRDRATNKAWIIQRCFVLSRQSSHAARQSTYKRAI